MVWMACEDRNRKDEYTLSWSERESAKRLNSTLKLEIKPVKTF